MSRARAAAIVVRDGRVLLMWRRRAGEEYWVVPGGGIEPGESPAQACARELAEETSLVAGAVDLVHVDATARTEYFLVTGAIGEPCLGGPEALRDNPTNRYRLEWVPSEALPRTLRPATACRAIVAAVDRANNDE